jgi:hypothetical protein
MLHGTLEDNGRRDYPDTLEPTEDTSEYEVRFDSQAGFGLFFTTREAAETVAHRVNIYSVTPDHARVIEWRLSDNKGRRIPIAL